MCKNIIATCKYIKVFFIVKINSNNQLSTLFRTLLFVAPGLILLFGLSSSPEDRLAWWWSTSIVLTIFTLSLNAIIQRIETRYDNKVSDKYSTFITAIIEAHNNGVLSGGVNSLTQSLVHETWKTLFDEGCRISYYSVIFEEVKDDSKPKKKILKSTGFNRYGKRGYLAYKIEDEDRLNYLLDSITDGAHVIYEDIRRKKYVTEMSAMGINVEDAGYKSFVRIPVGRSLSGVPFGVLIADSDRSCYFKEDGVNYLLAKRLAEMIQYTQFNREQSVFDLSESTGKEVASAIG